ncbi:MAG: hypothetical protein Q8K75_06685 [Chlamydiales bacterium]|nr:hypothetical protein [Chlamydiales bacterium]
MANERTTRRVDMLERACLAHDWSEIRNKCNQLGWHGVINVFVETLDDFAGMTPFGAGEAVLLKGTAKIGAGLLKSGYCRPLLDFTKTHVASSLSIKCGLNSRLKVDKIASDLAQSVENIAKKICHQRW